MRRRPVFWRSALVILGNWFWGWRRIIRAWWGTIRLRLNLIIERGLMIRRPNVYLRRSITGNCNWGCCCTLWLLVELLKFLLLLLLADLLLPHSLNELMRVSHDLWNEVMLIVILKIVYLLQVLIVLPCDSLNIRYQVLVLQVESPVLLEVVYLIAIVRCILILFSRNGRRQNC